VGILLTDAPLSRRSKVAAQRIGLSADLAYATTHVVDLHQPSRILDPFCGSGTLLLEAGAAHPDAELWGSDWTPGAVDAARANLREAGFIDRSRLTEQDALQMADAYPRGTFDAIVTNPPFGLKMGARINFHRFYRRWLEQADLLLKPDGRLSLWAHKRTHLEQAIAKNGMFRVDRTIAVQTGVARPTLFSLRRR
ncbi:MAG: methyltransferase, partial [Myxococcota bacterium]